MIRSNLVVYLTFPFLWQIQHLINQTIINGAFGFQIDNPGRYHARSLQGADRMLGQNIDQYRLQAEDLPGCDFNIRSLTLCAA